MGKLGPYCGLIHEMWEAGATDPEIAGALMELGVEVSEAAICQYRQKRCWAANGRNRKWRRSPAEIARMKEQKRHMTYRELQDYWGLSKPTIWRYLKDLHDSRLVAR